MSVPASDTRKSHALARALVPARGGSGFCRFIGQNWASRIYRSTPPGSVSCAGVALRPKRVPVGAERTPPARRVPEPRMRQPVVCTCDDGLFRFARCLGVAVSRAIADESCAARHWHASCFEGECSSSTRRNCMNRPAPFAFLISAALSALATYPSIAGARLLPASSCTAQGPISGRVSRMSPASTTGPRAPKASCVAILTFKETPNQASAVCG